jgi:hypothetical protein
VVGSGQWLTLEGANISIGAINVTSSLMGALASSATSMVTGTYSYGVARFSSIAQTPADNTIYDSTIYTRVNTPVTIDRVSLATSFGLDVSDVNNLIFTISADPQRQAQYGTLSADVNGDPLYTPDQDYIGDDQFDYAITDGVSTFTGTLYLTPEVISVNTPNALPQSGSSSPWGKVVYPVSSDMTFDVSSNSDEMTINFENANPGEFVGEIAVRAVFDNGYHVDIKKINGATASPVKIKQADLLTEDGHPFAFGSVRWELVRLISRDSISASGQAIKDNDPLEFEANIARPQIKADMAAMLTRTGIVFLRENVEVGSTSLISNIGKPNLLDNTYITGTKIQPIAFSGDLSRVFVAGNGKLFVIDTLTFKLIDTIEIPAGQNITSVACVGSMLIIGEGNNWGTGNYRLMAMNINPASEDYQKITNLPLDAALQGVGGMAIGPDGKTLVVSTPLAPNAGGLITSKAKPGNVWIYDLSTFDSENPASIKHIKATLPTDDVNRGKVPQMISATHDPDHFLVADIGDTNRGLATLVIKRSDDGKLESAAMKAIDMTQPLNIIRKDRLNIQHAQSAVLVERDGVEYAIVSDDNRPYQDAYWTAQFAAPMFVHTSPFGPPTAMGGSMSAKKVLVGGKLGIIKDPFGEKPEFLGATLPMDGQSIMNLSVSEDGKVLIGQIKGGYRSPVPSYSSPTSGTVFDFGPSMTQQPHGNHAWSVDDLINAAKANDGLPPEQRLQNHLEVSDGYFLPSAKPEGSNYTAAVAGTVFDPDTVKLDVKGNVGDIIEVDMKRRIAYQLCKETFVESRLPADDSAKVKKLLESGMISGFKIIAFDELDQDKISILIRFLAKWRVIDEHLSSG